MKTLHLFRHAKSSWDDPRLADFERPLAKRGRRACETIARHMAERGIAPEFVLCSPAERTRETLAAILHVLPTDAEIQRPETLYMGSAGTILALVNTLPEDVETALIIGHNPAIQAAALQLAAAGGELEALRNKFPTAALATLEFSRERWQDVVPGAGILVAFARPRELA